MENQIKVFENAEFGQVRTVIDEQGEPWFVASDVCKALGIDNTATRRLDDDEKAPLRLMQTSSNGVEQGREVSIINEPGLYTLVLGSRKPEAKVFKRWITHEVIPSLRHNGGYIVGQETMTESELREANATALENILTEKERLRLKLFSKDPLDVVNAHNALVEMEVKPLREKIEADAPMVQFANAVTETCDNIMIRDMAKLLNDEDIDIGEKRLYSLLRNYQVLMDNNAPYQTYMDRGYFARNENVYLTPYGKRLSWTTVVTPKGQIWLVSKVAEWLAEKA